jgi:hypothetical protein
MRNSNIPVSGRKVAKICPPADLAAWLNQFGQPPKPFVRI